METGHVADLLREVYYHINILYKSSNGLYILNFSVY